jgi:hypothetical protein
MSNAAAMALNGMVREWDSDAEAVAKFLKCRAIIFPHLTLATAGWPPCSKRGAGMMRSDGLGGTDHDSKMTVTAEGPQGSTALFPRGLHGANIHARFHHLSQRCTIRFSR